jgi:hypothetical protein
MNTNPTSSKSLIVNSIISLVIFIIVGAVVYMYFNAFVLKRDDNSAAMVKTQEEIEHDKKLSEISAPPRSDIQLTEQRGAEIQSDLRAKQESPTASSTSTNQAARSQLLN